MPSIIKEEVTSTNFTYIFVQSDSIPFLAVVEGMVVDLTFQVTLVAFVVGLPSS